MMSPRRAAILAVALALSACHDVNQEPRPADLVFATYASPNIPTPNDLALAALVSLSKANNCAAPIDACTLPAALKNAQIELLCTFRGAGGFPSDQEVPISIPLTALRLDAATNSYLPAAAPAIDVATVTASTVAVLRVDVSPPTVEQVEASSAPGSCAGTPVVCTPGTLTLRKKADATGSRRWAAGARYALAVRGGPSGVRTTTGLRLDADSAIALTIPNKNLTLSENQPLGNIPDSSPANTCGAGTNADEIALLENVRGALWNPLSWSGGSTTPWHPTPSAAVTPAFAAVDAVFPHAEAAAVATFGTAPVAGALVLIDSGSGVAPLPLDLLRTGAPIPPSTQNTIAFNAGFGPAAQGLTTLDGFSTTAMILAQTSIPVDASTVNGANVHLFKLNGAAAPILVKELKQELGILAAGGPGNPAAAGYVAEPTPIVVAQGQPLSATVTCPAAGGCSPAIGLQPAVGAPTPAGTFYLPPLDEASSYAVVVTKRVKDMLGNPLVKPTVAKILLDFTTPFLANGASAIPGVNTATATALTAMKAELAPVLANLPSGTVAADVVTAYTFRTQSVTAGALALRNAAVPTANPAAASFFTAAEIGAAYGIDPAVAFPGTSIREFAEVTFPTVNFLLSGLSAGAFDPAHPTPELITALVAVPDPALVTAPCPAGFPAGARCAPLVLFRHGIPRSRADMLPLAAALAAKGFVVAAIDAEKFGDRTYCTADNQCLPPATCVADAKLKGPTDAGIVGRCAGGALLRKRVDCVLPDPQCAQTGALAAKGVPLASGNLLFNSLNFFRTRDTFRQDIIDQSALVAALAPTAPRAVDPFAARLAGYATPIAVDPDQVYFAGVSLGAENGALTVAVNPRIKKAAFQAGFATIIDDVSNPASSDFAALTALFASATPPVLPGTPLFLQFLQVAKWILDPGDAANYTPLIKAAGTPVLSQIGLCDSRIPSAQSQYFTATLGLPIPAAGDAGTGFTQWFVNSATTNACPADGVIHGFLVDPSQSRSLTDKAQQSFADFLATGAPQPTTVRP